MSILLNLMLFVLFLLVIIYFSINLSSQYPDDSITTILNYILLQTHHVHLQNLHYFPYYQFKHQW